MPELEHQLTDIIMDPGLSHLSIMLPFAYLFLSQPCLSLSQGGCNPDLIL